MGTQGPKLPQSVSAWHSAGTPGCGIGKYCSPTLSPVDAGSVRNEVIAALMESHLVVLASDSVPLIEEELSSRTYIERGIRCPSSVSVAQAASAVSGSPSFPPNPPSVPIKDASLDEMVPPPVLAKNPPVPVDAASDFPAESPSAPPPPVPR